MKNFLLLLFGSSIFTACEKVINPDYKANQSRIIIEGNITNQPGPYVVKISRSIPLSSTSNYPGIDNAMVSISDDAGNSETLVPEGNGSYHTTAIIGTEGRTYTLLVQAEGQSYTAQSTMPSYIPFDSIKVETIYFAGDTEYNVIPVYRDPVARGNYYRFVLTYNHTLINQHLVQTDDIKNGVVNTLKLEINNDDLEFKTGDSIRLEMQCIDKQAGLFYKTLALMGDSGPGGGTTPNNPPNNLSNGALGLFSAHTIDVKSVVIP